MTLNREITKHSQGAFDEKKRDSADLNLDKKLFFVGLSFNK